MIDLTILGINWINLGILFLWTFITCFGVPGALVLLVSSGAVANSFFELIPIILVGALAAILGDITAYELARRFSLGVNTRLKKYKFYINGETRARELLKKYEFFSVFITRFGLTELCAAMSYISGFEKLNRKKLILAVIFGELIYVSMYPIIGFIFKETWNDLIKVVQDVFYVIILILIVLILLKIILDRRRKIKE